MKLICPVKGICKDITEATDPAFSQKMLGDGVCIQPQDTNVFSPVTGEVTMVFPTKHAVGIKTEDGTEILLHLGVDTVELNGKYFECYVKANDKISSDTLLINYDYKGVNKEGYNTDIMVIITSKSKEIIKQLGKKNKGDLIAEVK